MRNTAHVTGGKPIAVFLQSISGVTAFNPLAAFNDIHGGKREVLFFYFVPDTTRGTHRSSLYIINKENGPYPTTRAQCGLLGDNDYKYSGTNTIT
jgi:hypothetical protein